MNEQQPDSTSSAEVENNDSTDNPALEGPVTVVILATADEQELEALFAPMAEQPDVTFIVAFAFNGKHEMPLPALRHSYAGMPVTIAKEGTPLVAGNIFVIPPEARLLARDGVLQSLASQRDGARRERTLLESTVVNRGHRGIVVLLTWNGADPGALREVKASGGIVLAATHLQHESAANETSAAHVFDRFLPKPELGTQLVRLLDRARRFRTSPAAQELARDAATHLERILAIVRTKTGHDFRQYKRNTIIRRVQRRMHVAQVDSVDGYIDHLRSDEREADLLFQDMLIGITHFFRDPEAFELLRTRVVPDILTNKTPGSVVRVWVPGCATGEEAYSIAFLFLDYIDRHDLDLKLQVFATDIDEQALHAARRGIYPPHVEGDVPPDLLRPFMYKAEGVLRVNKRVCDCVMFSVHNVVKHPPFSKLDFIACRNLFIYFSAELQARLIPMFHYALLPKGYLFLGLAEGLGSLTDLFSVFDKRFRIFKRSELHSKAASPRAFNFAVPGQDEGDERRLAKRGEKTATGPGLATLVQRTLLQAYSPACVVINERFETLYFFGQTGRFLQPAEGAPTLNLLDLARPGLRTQLRACIREAITRRAPAASEPIARLETGPQRVRILVKPMTEQAPEAGIYLVIFQEEDARRQDEAPEPSEGVTLGDAAMEQLELELKRTQEQLQGSIEEFESSNEELKSSNEELLSMNEELQSSNEELETAKEELQSLNEELETINSELKFKVDELAHANSDIRNLFENTRIATLFLDNDLRIRNFTPATGQLFSLIESDRGRPIGHIAQHFRCEALETKLCEVIRSLVPFEAHVEARDGAWFIMRILPYRSTENVIEGVVLTFTDVTQLKRAELEVQRLNRAAEAQLRWMKTVMDVIPAGIAYYDNAVLGVHLNRAAGEILGLPPESSVRADVDGLAHVVWRDLEVPDGSRQLYKVLVANEAKRDRRVELITPAGRRQLVLHSAIIEDEKQGSSAQVSAFLDITDIQLAREEAVTRQQHAIVAELGLRALEAVNLDEFLSSGLSVLPQVAFVDAAEVLKIQNDALEAVRRIGFEAERSAAVAISPADAIPDDGRVLLLDDVTDETAWSEVLRQEGFTSGARLSISSPEGRAFGVLAVYTRQRRLFSRHDLAFLRSLANVFASAVQRQVIEETKLREREHETMQRSEAQLRRAERLASLGTFATGIAHELNNPLNNISLAAESMEVDGDTGRRAKMLQNIRNNAERCGRIIESVLRFARDESSRKWPIDLNALVHHVTSVVQSDFGPERLRFELDLDESLSAVRCNPTEMEQVFTNLIRNAVQAHPGLCTVRIKTERIGHATRITVTDDGSGISEKDVAHVFDPFFSTRRRSGGTGLGLSITHRIVTSHGGTIRATRDDGGGAKFVIELPCNIGEELQGEGNGQGFAD